MTLRIIAAFALLIAVAYPAAGQTDEETTPDETRVSLLARLQALNQHPLEKENPDQLKVSYFQYGQCPFTETSIEYMIDGLLVRSRLKQPEPGEWGVNDSTYFHLRVDVFCGDDDDESFRSIYMVEAKFRQEVTLHKSKGPLKVEIQHVHQLRHGSAGNAIWGTYNKGSEQSNGTLRNSIREVVEAALTDYLKANFDL